MNSFFGRNFFATIFFLIILLSIFLRFYKLGVNPPSLTWDEASIGYNAYSILQTGADEYGNKFPLSIRSFDDYKPPLYVYLTVPSVGIFGLSEFAVRLPAAILGVLSIIASYFLTKELLQKWDKRQQELIALTAAFFLAISPWHLQFSRGAFEGNIGIFFLMIGIILFIGGLRNGRLLMLSGFPFVLSVYSYHSFRMLVPLLLVFLGFIFWKELLKKKLFATIFLALLIIFTFPVYFSFVKAQASGSRLSMVTVFSDPTIINPSIKRIDHDKGSNDFIGAILHNRRIVYSLAIIKGYLDHFNPDFLFIHGDGGVQHHAVEMGMLYLWELPFILAGLYILINRRNRYAFILITLFLLAPLPSAITTGTPHPIRAIALMPAFHIFTAVGVVFILLRILRIKIILYKFLLLFIVIFSFLLNFVYYLHQYYVHTPVEYGYFWQYGYKEALNYAKEKEKQFANIIMTYEYDQPYIYYLFYNKIDPKWYQKNWDYNRNGVIDRFRRVIGKYTFRNIIYSNDIKIPDSLLIGTPEEIPDNVKILKTITFPDGKVAFKIIET